MLLCDLPFGGAFSISAGGSLSTTHRLGGTDGIDERRIHGTCDPLDEQRRDALTGKLLRATLQSHCHAAPVGPCSGRSETMSTAQRERTKGIPTGDKNPLRTLALDHTVGWMDAVELHQLYPVGVAARREQRDAARTGN